MSQYELIMPLTFTSMFCARLMLKHYLTYITQSNSNSLQTRKILYIKDDWILYITNDIIIHNRIITINQFKKS
jgi:hypothetical protein